MKLRGQILSSVIHSEKIKSEQNQLLEVEHGERMNTGKKSPSGSADKALASVGEINRA